MDLKKIILKNKDTIFFAQNFSDKDKMSSELDCIAKQLDNGVKIIVFKNNELNDEIFIKNASKILQLCAIYQAVLLIYNRCDIAKLTDSDGVILDKNSLSFENAKKLLHDDNKIIGYFANKNENLEYKFDLIISKCKTNNCNYLLENDLAKRI